MRCAVCLLAPFVGARVSFADVDRACAVRVPCTLMPLSWGLASGCGSRTPKIAAKSIGGLAQDTSELLLELEHARQHRARTDVDNQLSAIENAAAQESVQVSSARLERLETEAIAEGTRMAELEQQRNRSQREVWQAVISRSPSPPCHRRTHPFA